jgi:hypothetical protein
MGDRRKLNCRVDEDVISDFREFVDEKKGKVRGELGREVERALTEYMDRDRYARIEEEQAAMNDKLDAALAALADDGSHTHTASATPQTQPEKAEQIGAILNEGDAKVIPNDDVEEAIREVAGASKRTLRDYKELLKQKGHAFAHPSSDSHVWTVDPDVFANWAESHINDVPDAYIMDVLEEYPIDLDEYERRVPA